MRAFYTPSGREVQFIKIPAFKFIMIDRKMRRGESPETSAEFSGAFGALYSVAHTLKFMSKLRERNPIDYPVMPLEGLWWSKGGGFDLGRIPPWSWTVMIMQPKHITETMFRKAVAQVREKRPNPFLTRVRLKSFREGLSVQIMHVGPYADERRTIEKMRAFAEEHNLRLRGRHHEIYLAGCGKTRGKRKRMPYLGVWASPSPKIWQILSIFFSIFRSLLGDPRRTKPERLKTILRHPVEKAK